MYCAIVIRWLLSSAHYKDAINFCLFLPARAAVVALAAPVVVLVGPVESAWAVVRQALPAAVLVAAVFVVVAARVCPDVVCPASASESAADLAGVACPMAGEAGSARELSC